MDEKKSKNSIEKIDVEIIRRFKNGNIKAFEAIFKAYLQQLFEFALSYLKEEQLAEDIVQDVYAHIWQNRKKIKSDVNMKAYLYKAVKNKCLNEKRHQKIKCKFEDSPYYIPASVEMPDQVLNRKEVARVIDKAIQELPEKRRIIFTMHRFDKLTYKEIAQIQKISIRTVETQIKRSRIYLENRLSHLLYK